MCKDYTYILENIIKLLTHLNIEPYSNEYYGLLDAALSTSGKRFEAEIAEEFTKVIESANDSDPR